jgi:hypothetical protein
MASWGQRKVKLAVPDWGLAYCADWTAGGESQPKGRGRDLMLLLWFHQRVEVGW